MTEAKLTTLASEAYDNFIKYDKESRSDNATSDIRDSAMQYYGMYIAYRRAIKELNA
jgi:hypothetical protein